MRGLRHAAPVALVAAGALLAAGWPVLAQTLPEGGMRLSFGISERLEASDNPTFLAEPEEGQLTSLTGLSFGYRTQTRISQLDVTADTALRAQLLGDDPDVQIDSPRLGFAYRREAAAAQLVLQGSFRRDDIAYLRPLEDILAGALEGLTDEEIAAALEDGTGIDFPTDITDLEGRGTGTERRLAASLDLLRNRPVAIGLDAALSETLYEDVEAEDLNDSRRLSLGADATFRPRGPLQFGLDLGWSRIERDAGAESDTVSLDASVSLDRPRGPLTLEGGITRTEGDERYSLSFGRSFETRTTSLDVDLGATVTASGPTAVTGSLNYRLQGAQSALTLAAQRQVLTEEEGERVFTSLSASYGRPLTETLSLSLDAGLVRSETPDADEATTLASLGASVSYALTRDWSVSLGYDYRLRDATGRPDVDENVVFLGLSRSFDVRP